MQDAPDSPEEAVQPAPPMRRAEVVACVVIGFVAVLAIAVGPPIIAAPLAYLLQFALYFWFVGVAFVFAALLLRRRAVSRRLVRAIGIVGVTWSGLVVAFYVIVLVLFAVAGPIGP